MGVDSQGVAIEILHQPWWELIAKEKVESTMRIAEDVDGRKSTMVQVLVMTRRVAEKRSTMVFGAM